MRVMLGWMLDVHRLMNRYYVNSLLLIRFMKAMIVEMYSNPGVAHSMRLLSGTCKKKYPYDISTPFLHIWLARKS